MKYDDKEPTRSYTEWVDGTPVFVEVFDEGTPEARTRVDIRGKIWVCDGVEDAAGAYDRINAVVGSANDKFKQHSTKRKLW